MATELQKRRNDEVIRQLKLHGIDAYLIITCEGSDPITSLTPGISTVIAGAFLFTASGERIAVCAVIDAQDIEESGYFTRVVKYKVFEETLTKLLQELNPKVIALNDSQNDPLCDGLTVGQYQKLKLSLGNTVSFREVSSETFIPAVRSVQ